MGHFSTKLAQSEQVVVSCRLSIVEPKSSKLFGMNGALSLVVWFLGPIFTQKTRSALAFYFFRLIKIEAKFLPSLREKKIHTICDQWMK